MASLVRYVVVPGNSESLTHPKLIKEIVIDDVVVSTAAVTFSEIEASDKAIGLEFIASYKDYVLSLIEQISSASSLLDISYNDLALIKLATISLIDMIDAPLFEIE